MMRLTVMAALVALLTTPTSNADWDFSAFEDGYWYVGGQAMYATVDSDSGDANPTALHLLGGYQVTPLIGIESRIGLGVDDDTADDGVRLDIDAYFGIYTTLTVPLGDWVRLYGLVGATRMEVDLGFRSQDEDHETDLTYGAGLLLNFNEDIAISLEATQWLDQGDFDVSGVMLGIRYDF